jgi:hypothetical protein
MKIQSTTLLLILSLLTALTSRAADAAANPDPKYEQFKRQMLPKVGQKITFIGTITSGKFGPYVTPDHWVGIYIEATTTNRADLAKLNKVGREQGRNLKVEGVLHFTQGYPGLKIDGMQAAGVPEHFFFHVGEISFSETKVGADEKAKK